jgi:hypothetical protein
MAQKHGYTTVDEYKEDAQKRFSLLELGIIDQPSTRLLLVNVSMQILLAKRKVLISYAGNTGWIDADRRLYVTV